MRIIGGSAAGTILKVPKGYDVRPTPDLVRQAIFNSLAGRVLDAAVLELFGGTGALSLECLSRGATSAICVEKAYKHAQFIKQNLHAAKLQDKPFDVRIKDAFVALHQLADSGQKFDLIVADPPFGDKNVNRRSTSFSQKLLDDERLPELLTENGLLILGHTKRDTLEIPPPWSDQKILKHGDSWFRFLTAE
ncbi:MAG: RsmD family RNA methyltransferase [Verrucomicrobiia bacterium]|jgi:16S rRNA (guanine966-N2)-methyltransferase